ncbi:MAG: hypothetical protein ACI4M9_03415 [Succinivibrio sp.]
MFRHLICIVGFILLGVGVYLGGIMLSSFVVDNSMHNFVNSMNEFVESKYSSKVFIDKPHLTYEMQSSKWDRQNGFVKVSFEDSDRFYTIPVKVYCRFLSVHADFDLKGLVKDLLVESELMKNDAYKQTATVDIRLLYPSAKFIFNLNGDYSEAITGSGAVPLKGDSFKKLALTFLYTVDATGFTETIVEANNVYLPGVSADYLYYSSCYNKGDEYEIPGRAHVYASGLNIGGEILSHFKMIDFKLNPSSLNEKGDFSVNVNGILSTNYGSAIIKAKLGILNSSKISELGYTWSEAVLNPKILNAVTRYKLVNIDVNTLDYNANIDSPDGKILYRLNANGRLSLDANDKGVVNALNSSNGRFKVSFDHMNEKGFEFISDLGENRLSRYKGTLRTSIEVKNGKLIFREQDF